MFNEFWIIVWRGYGIGNFVFGKKDSFGIYLYIVGYNFIKVYVKIYRFYYKNYSV